MGKHKYSATVRFEVLEFEAPDLDTANEILNELIDDLGQVDTAVGWDNVDWVITEGGN